MSVLIAIVNTVLSLLQFRATRHRPKLDVFDRRFKVYNATRIVLHQATADLSPSTDEIRTFWQLTDEATFLFDKPTTLFLHDLSENLKAMHRNAKKLNDVRFLPEHGRLLAEEQKRTKLLLEAQQNLENIFRPSLDLSKIK